MANCKICGKSVAFMGGGKEPYTGKELYVCNDCGLILKKLNTAAEETNSGQFKIVKNQLLKTVKGKAFENMITKYSNALEQKIVNVQQSEEDYKQRKVSFLTTTGYNFEGYAIKKYLGIINGQVVLGTGFLSEFFASKRSEKYGIG